MNNLWMDHVPEKWFEFKHTIHSFAFCVECDLYGERQWNLEEEYDAILISAPYAYNLGDRWVWICLECFYPDYIEHFDEKYAEDYEMEIDNIEQNPYDMG